MNIDRDSWHYKVVMAPRYVEPRSLCTYFWSFVATLTVLPVVAIAAAVAALFLLLLVLVCAVNPVFTLVGYLFWGVDGSFFVHMVDTFYGLHWASRGGLGEAISVLLWGTGLYLLYQDYREKMQWDENEPAVLSAMGVVRSFFAAKKRKVCPLIEYQGRR